MWNVVDGGDGGVDIAANDFDAVVNRTVLNYECGSINSTEVKM